ncbi:MAG: repair protein recO [Pseudomonadota bacterium]|jgi:DNA repair protein RecO (recombination protein O)
MAKSRIDHQPAYLLHTYPWRETSLIVEAFSRDYGRVALVARGARRPGSALRGVLLAFMPLELSWFGQGELRTLVRAEWQGGQALLQGQALMCGYYLNELLLRLSARDDAHPQLFERYRDTVAQLAAGAPLEPLLRGFEAGLLRELGYGVALDVEADSGAPLEPETLYSYIIERGVVRGAHPGQLVFPGQVLLDIAQGCFLDARSLSCAKRLMRHLINHQLGGKPLESRRVWKELQAL